MSDISRHVMFADCFREICDDELKEEYLRVLPMAPSHWRTAVLCEVSVRDLVSAREDIEGA